MGKKGAGDDDLWEQVKKSVKPMKKGKNLLSKSTSGKSRQLENLKESKPNPMQPGSDSTAKREPISPSPASLSMDTVTFRKISRGRMRDRCHFGPTRYDSDRGSCKPVEIY